MDTEYDTSRVEQARRALEGSGQSRRDREKAARLTPVDIDVANDWGDTKILPAAPEKRREFAFLRKLVYFSIATVVLSAGYLVYKILDPFAKPSDKNIAIEIVTPVSVAPGSPAEITVRVTNHNRVSLEFASAVLLFPNGTRSVEDPDLDKKDARQSFERIESGQTVQFRTNAILLGEENQDLTLAAKLEYRFGSVSSVFTKSVERHVLLAAAPIDLRITALRDVTAGQEFDIIVDARSNASIALRDVLFRIDYPAGYTFMAATPAPTVGSNAWKIGRLAPGESRSFRIKGVLTGEPDKAKAFHLSVGVGSDRTEREVSVRYASDILEIGLERPFIGIDLAANGVRASEAVIPFGGKVSMEVQFRNDTPTRIVDAEIEVKLRGVPLDKRAIIASNGGYYRSTDDVIFWDKRAVPGLAALEAGGGGMVSFEFIPLTSDAVGFLQNPSMVAEVSVRGRRVSQAGAQEEVRSFLAQNVKMTSQLQFASRVVYYDGPFANRGPIPPRVEQETTYTVLWTFVNSTNDIEGLRVRATLPVYVSWVGSVLPFGEKVTYNAQRNEVVWDVGRVDAGVGTDSSPREVAFQLLFNPSLSLLDQSPDLIYDISYTGRDTFTGAAIQGEAESGGINLETDPGVTDDAAGRVAE